MSTPQLGRLNKVSSPYITLFTALMAVVLVICMLLFPDRSFQASLEGLNIWWKIVFPALLPFLILTEMFIAFGLIHGLGKLLEPFMRHGFRLPGIAGWAIALSLASGPPAGAALTVKLTQQGHLTPQEGERLLSLSHLVSPIFIMSVVAVGFMHQQRMGWILAILYYVSAMLTGILFRIATSKKQHLNAPVTSSLVQPLQDSRSISRRCLDTMEQARMEDGRTFGKVLGDAVSASVHALMVIGGFMIIFSVFHTVFQLTGSAKAVSTLITPLLSPLGMTDEHVNSLLKGVFEQHLGSYAASQMTSSTMMLTTAIVCAILAWGGLSLHAQVHSYCRQARLRYKTFLLFRSVHALLAIALTVLCWTPLQRLLDQSAAPSFLRVDRLDAASSEPFTWNGWLQFEPSLIIMTSFIALALVYYILTSILRLLRPAH